MQLLLMESKPRKPRPKRDAVAITFRISPSVKIALTESAEKYGRSENQQAEFLLKVGYLNTSGIATNGMTDREILEKFDEVIVEVEFDD